MDRVTRAAVDAAVAAGASYADARFIETRTERVRVKNGAGEALVANTNIKLIMKIEDARSAEEIQKRAAKEWVMTPGSIRKEFGTVKTTEYADSYAVQERERLKTLDLVALKPGEAFCIYEDKLVKFRVPFVKGVPVKHIGILKPVALSEAVQPETGTDADGNPFVLSPEQVRRNLRDVTAAIRERGEILVPITPEILGGLYSKIGAFGIDVLFGLKPLDEIPPFWQAKFTEAEQVYLSLGEQMVRKHGERISRENEMARAVIRDAREIGKILEAV